MYGIAAKNKVQLTTPAFLEKYQPLLSDENEFYQSLSPSEQDTLISLVGDMGYNQSASDLVWTHMVPDNSPRLLQFFAKHVLNIPGVH